MAMPCIYWRLQNFLAAFTAFDASTSIFKTPNSSFPCQEFVPLGNQEMWALIAADWLHRQKSCSQEIIGVQASCQQQI
jgi:hypothetical protein